MKKNIELAAMAALQNAVDTIFVEKSSEMTLENFIWIAAASVLDTIEGGSYGEMSDAEVSECEAETKQIARSMFHLYASN